MTNDDTDKLLQQACTGNEDALFTLYTEFKDAVFHFALSITNDYHYSQDILQDTFVKIRTGSYTSGNAKAYIFTITRNLALSYIRSRGKNCDEDCMDSIAKADDIGTNLELWQALLSLEPIDRQIVLLHVLGGFKHYEISGLLSIPAGTVMWKYHRAISKLKNAMSERGNSNEKQKNIQLVKKSDSIHNA